MPEQSQPVPPNLTYEVSRLSEVITKLYRRNSLWHSFMSGVFSGLGYVVGASIVFALLVYLLGKVNLVPVIGEWLGAVLQQAIGSMTPR